MNNSYIKDKDEDEGMTLDSETSTQDPPSTGQLIDSDDKTKTTENFWGTNTKSIVSLGGTPK